MSYAVLAGALSIGLSPVLYEWGAHLRAEPATRYALIFPLLLLAAVRRAPRERPWLRRGLPWLAAAAIVEVLAFMGGVPRYGRLALPLGVIGWLRASGLAPLPVALLAVWLVPVPRFAGQLGFGAPARLWSAWANAWLPGSGDALALDPWDSGLRLIALLAGIGWFAGLRRQPRLGAAAGRAALYGLAGVPAQALGVLVAAALLAAGASGASLAWRVHGLWMASALLALAPTFLIARRHRETTGG